MEIACPFNAVQNIFIDSLSFSMLKNRGKRFYFFSRAVVKHYNYGL